MAVLIRQLRIRGTMRADLWGGRSFPFATDEPGYTIRYFHKAQTKGPLFPPHLDPRRLIGESVSNAF